MAEPRKIELQSPEDLQHLIAVARRAANAKIDEALPKIEGPDAMRRRVEEDVHNYINEVYTATFPSITLNGLSPDEKEILQKAEVNAEGVEEEYEPFNAKLFARAQDLARQEEDLLEERARMRRKVPVMVLEGTKRAYKEGLEADEEGVRIRGEKMAKRVKMEGQVEGGVLGVGRLESQESVEGGWRRGVEGLQRVLGGMPGVVAKCERAGKAEAYVIGMGGK